jgi:hypothetical protein
VVSEAVQYSTSTNSTSSRSSERERADAMQVEVEERSEWDKECAEGGVDLLTHSLTHSLK